MRAVDSWLDRFARKHPRLGVPRLMLYIVIGNILVFFFDLFSSGAFSAMLAFPGNSSSKARSGGSSPLSSSR